MQTFDQPLQIAVNHHKAGELAMAEAEYRQLLAIRPDDPGILHVLGVLFQQTNRREMAIEFIQKSIEIRPNFPEALNNLSVSLNEIGRFELAKKACEKAIRLKPAYVAAYINLGNSLRELGRSDEAIRAYNAAAKLQPPSSVLMTNLSAVMHDRGDADAGIAAAKQAVSIDPQSPLAHEALGQNLKSAGRIPEALQSYDAAINLRPADSSLHSSRLYCLNFSTEHDSAAIQKELAEWNERHAAPLFAGSKPHDNETSMDRRLRIGYVSPHFRAQSMSFFAMPIMRCHDARQVEVYCYSDVARPDDITREFQAHAQHWRPIVGLGDEQVAAMIRADRIDILIDPTMHMKQNRLLVFARKPAPVQVTWLGYPGSSGLGTMDYRLTDRYLEPPGNSALSYSEELQWLPHSFWCYDPLTREPEVNALPALTAGHITFGCLNNFCKINQGTIELFAHVLNAVKNSRLLMLCPCESARVSTLNQFEFSGIDRERIQFVALRPRKEYLRTYHRIDISLDVLPYNGHTTTMDSLWMGVPVISQVGKTAVGRAGLSILSNMDLTDLVAPSAAEYVHTAVRLSTDIDRLNVLRRSLRGRLTESPLMDARQFVLDLELAYRRMWNLSVK